MTADHGPAQGDGLTRALRRMIVGSRGEHHEGRSAVAVFLAEADARQALEDGAIYAWSYVDLYRPGQQSVRVEWARYWSALDLITGDVVDASDVLRETLWHHPQDSGDFARRRSPNSSATPGERWPAKGTYAMFVHAEGLDTPELGRLFDELKAVARADILAGKYAGYPDAVGS